jgi:hypothetical protein
VTAATNVDLLELGWPRVEEIVRDHPRVADVLRAFCDDRLKADAASRAEVDSRAGIGGSSPYRRSGPAVTG